MSGDGSSSVPARVVVALTGASGAVYGLRALQLLRALPDVETHLVVSPSAVITIRHELDLPPGRLAELADVVHGPGSIGASIASGSFATQGMLVAPCSIKTLSAIAHSYSDSLITRAADVTLKEGRPLVLLVRETPLHLGHLRLMAAAAEAGAVIAPPVPAFYTKPASLEEVVDHTVSRALVRLGLPEHLLKAPWQGLPRPQPAAGPSE
ncbi:MAG: 3-octaprenyl-4-hydroxybenzoate carboxy-lyase [Frankiales bacterium]|jgi:4-hydroxy-3-polyprenylbenzoate decarboxylase|nr:3-octaprenyl-4-hydroxybenzoate carboxy-lyase [Frankiales bacterium]